MFSVTSSLVGRRHTKLAFTISLLSANVLAQTQAQSANSSSTTADVEEVYIVGVRENRTSKGAIGLALDIKETPQSISLVNRDLMDKYGANSLNDALRLATGINVEEWETNRTNYTARGFEIKNTQVDGVGMPNDWGIVTGAMDSFGYEKLEVIRGANGLLTGVGNSAGTINYVRKRPTNETQGSLAVSAGSYNFKRIEGDYSTPLTDDETWAGRVVFASEDKDSYLRGLSNDRTFLYGVVDGQVGEKSTLTLGYSYQKAHTKGNMWGALTLSNADGSQAEFDTSSSTTQDWTFWDTINQTAFVEYTYELTEGWNAKLSYNYRSYEDDSKLFFVYSETGLDENGGNLIGWPGSYPSTDESHLFDFTVDGNFDLWGREQQVILGLSSSKGNRDQSVRPFDPVDLSYDDLLVFPYKGNVYPEPVWGAKEIYATTNQTIKRGYGALKLGLTDNLIGVLGFNSAEYHRDGQSEGARFDQTERKTSPYAGLTYSFTSNFSVYGSYSDIYQPQDFTDINQEYLDPSKGVNYEVGAKAEWLDKRLLTTLAFFKAEQENLGTYVGMSDDGVYYYEGKDVNSKGVEAEITGRLNEYMDIVLGITSLKLEDQQGNKTYEWVPRRTVNLALNTKLPQFPSVAFGVSGRWQSDISKLDEYTNVWISQDNYAIFNVFASWDITKSVQLKVNIDNISDQKYIGSLYQVGFYGEPRNASASLKVSF